MRHIKDLAFSTRVKKGKDKDFSNPSSLEDKKCKRKIKCFYCNKARHKQSKCQKEIANEKNRVKKECDNYM